MEHSSHSHPLPHGRDGSPRLSARPCSALPPPNTAPSTSPYQALNPQSRRLQLRNTRFNGPSLPTRRISPLLGLTPGPIDSFNRPKDKDNSPPSVEKRSLYGENLPPSPVNILQEIHNSAKRRKASNTSGFGMMFEEQHLTDENSKPIDDDEVSWYEERSNECSPSLPRGSSSTTALRESSVNQMSPPPLNLLSTKETACRVLARSNLRTDDIEQSRYIEHIESQLVSAQAKIDALASPKTSKMRSVKLRSLTMEIRNLRIENAGWASRAEEMVQHEKVQYADLQNEMRSQLQALEEDVEIKDARIAEFEWELESLRAQVKNAEGLEEANANLEKKIDMLSSLLVNSPDKFDSHSTATSPVRCSARFSPSKRRDRPTSVLSRESTSPTGKRLSLAAVSEQAFWDSRSRSASIVEAPEDSSPLEDQDELAQSPMMDAGAIPLDLSKRLSYSESYDDSRNGTSFGTRTGPPSSRPTSIMSTSSVGAPSWGVPMLPDSESRFGNRQRRMRKFPSGSSTLKPLILPVASTPNVQSLPGSASIYPSIESVTSRDVSSSSSIDPTAAFLSKLSDSSQHSTPTVLSQQRSADRVREQTLNALEGKRKHAGGEGREIDGENCVASGSALKSRSRPSSSQRGRRSRPQSLLKELEHAGVEQAHLDAFGISMPDALEDDLVPRGLEYSTNHQPTHLPDLDAIPRACAISHQSKMLNTPPTSKPSNSTLPCTTIDEPRSLFARITNVVSRTKQDPFILARRILANAWTLGSASMGGLGWWLIGPLHHHQRYHALENGSNPEPAEVSQKTRSRGQGHWQHFSAEVRSGRIVDAGPARDYGSTWTPPSRSHNDNRHAAPPFLPPGSPRRSEPHLFPCPDCIEPSSRRTLRMWFQFSLTVVLAVGLAVKFGPGTLLAETSEGAGGQQHMANCSRVMTEHARIDGDHERNEERLRRRRCEQQQQQQQQQQRVASPTSDGYRTMRSGIIAADGGKASSSRFTDLDRRDGTDSGYGSIAFVEMLGPGDFEGG